MFRPLSMAALAMVAAGCAPLRPTAPADVPPALQPGDGVSLDQVVPAEGVQIYECRLRDAANPAAGYAWTLLGPEAQLFDAQGRRLGRHFGGPQWEALDGSRIAGAVKAHADAPAPDAVPWLLLQVRSVGPQGRFSRVTQVQRVATEGGLPPRADCGADQARTYLRVPYRAHYRFFTPR